MIVDCAISCPGNTPHVTAFRPSSTTFVRHSPYVEVSMSVTTDDRVFTHLKIACEVIHPSLSVFPYFLLQRIHVFLLHEELHKTFLIYVSSFRAPTDNLISRICSVDGRLRPNSPPSSLRQPFEVTENHSRLWRERFRRERRGRDLGVKIAEEDVTYVILRLRVAPLRQCLVSLQDC